MSITPEQLQQTIREAVAAAAQQWQEAAAQMRQIIGTLPAQVQPPPITSASLVDTRLLGKPFSFDGGAGWKDWSIVFQSCASACITLGTNRYSSRSFVFHAALLHAGHVVQRDNPHTSGERWCPGRPRSLETSCFAPRTDLVDAQRGYVARAPELQLRRRDCSANGPVRSATRNQAARTSRTTSASELLDACCRTNH